MKKSVIITLAAAIVILAGVGFWFSKRAKTSESTYQTMQVKRGRLRQTVLATGTVQPENRVEIKTPVAGRIDRMIAVEGQKVKKGQVLAWMSSTERAALLDAAHSEGPAELKKWEEYYKPTPILAPLDGLIILKSAESGQTVATTDVVYAMSDHLTVKAQVDETDLAAIKLKQKTTITLDAYPDVKIDATVDQIAYEAKTVNNVTTYIVDVLPTETPDFMRSGMTANLVFHVAEHEDVLTVPAQAVSIKEGVSYVKTGTPEKPEDHEVQTGLSDGHSIEIVSGLTEGETILIPTLSLEKKTRATNPFGPPSGPNRGGTHR